MKKVLFTAIALLLYNQYCYSLLLSVLLQFASTLFIAYTRPFKTSLNNISVICQEVMTLLCFLLLFRYANKDSVLTSAQSQATAKQFAFAVLLLTVVPPIVAFMEFVRMLRHVREICNWTREYKDDKESFESTLSEEEEAKEQESEDLIKGEGEKESMESMVEREITVSSEEGDEYNPKEYVREEPDSPVVARSTRFPQDEEEDEQEDQLQEEGEE